MKAAVNKGVQLGLADMVDPRSLTVDVRRLMGSATEDTAALGVVMVQVREAQCNPSIVKLKGKKGRHPLYKTDNESV